MSATIRIGIIEATIDGYQWTSTTKAFEELLNSMLDPGGPSGSDPNPDETAALEIVDKIGAELIKSEPAQYVERTVY